MKVMITSIGGGIDSVVDARFGRAHGFIRYDTDTNAWERIDNKQNLNAAQGAGIQSAQTVIDAGADAVITGNCGPKAFSVLKAAGIAVYVVNGGTVKDALDQLAAGSLAKSGDANVESHW